jgi:hypothetical protein
MIDAVIKDNKQRVVLTTWDFKRAEKYIEENQLELLKYDVIKGVHQYTVKEFQ